MQDGMPIPPAIIQLLTSTPHLYQSVWFTVHWDGSWNNYDFDCGDLTGRYYIPRGEAVTCWYGATGTYTVSAALYTDYALKTTATAQIEVRPRPSVYLPVVRR